MFLLPSKGFPTVWDEPKVRTLTCAKILDDGSSVASFFCLNIGRDLLVWTSCIMGWSSSGRLSMYQVLEKWSYRSLHWYVHWLRNIGYVVQSDCFHEVSISWPWLYAGCVIYWCGSSQFPSVLATGKSMQLLPVNDPNRPLWKTDVIAWLVRSRERKKERHSYFPSLLKDCFNKDQTVLHVLFTHMPTH